MRSKAHKIPPTPPSTAEPELSPSLGIHALLQWTSRSLPRMSWMSELILDKLESSERFHDPLQSLPPAAKELLLELPRIAWVTIGLFALDLLVMAGLILLAEFGFVHRYVVSVVLTVCMFVMFTVAHDAIHGSISGISWINGLVGRVAAGTMGPIACYPMFYALHHMHHRFTNNPAKDPDSWVSHGNIAMAPIRCMFNTCWYVVFYMKHARERPLMEILESLAYITVQACFLSTAVEYGWMNFLMTYWIIPSTLSHAFLAFFFDYIPHHHQTATPIQSRYHTTSMLQTYQILQPLLSILLQYQDYHLIHHLYPTIPFYRYADKWREKQDFLLDKNVDISRLTVSEVVRAHRMRAATM